MSLNELRKKEERKEKEDRIFENMLEASKLIERNQDPDKVDVSFVGGGKLAKEVGKTPDSFRNTLRDNIKHLLEGLGPEDFVEVVEEAKERFGD